MIQTWNLTKRFGDFVAVNGVSIEVDAGEILALLGPNGAGKTTTVRMLGSILQPTSGKGVVCGYDLVEDARMVRSIMGVLTEVPGLYARMNALEYLDFFGQLQQVPQKTRKQRIEQLMERFDLASARNRPIGTYSKGMRQKVALLRALIHDPRVLYLDEPTSAMDPYSAKTVRDFIGELRRADRTILICTHNLAEAELLADRIAIVNRGRVVAQGTIDQLKYDLLGPAQFELRLATPLNDLGAVLNGAVKVEESGDRWIRFQTSEPEVTNPAILRKVVEAGGEVTSLSHVERSLEEVYLRIVGEA